MRFQVWFVGALVNPEQNTEIIRSSDTTSSIGTIAIKCSGFGDGQEYTAITDMLEAIGSILSEPENEYIASLREKLSPSAAPKPKGFLQ